MGKKVEVKNDRSIEITIGVAKTAIMKRQMVAEDKVKVAKRATIAEL